MVTVAAVVLAYVLGSISFAIIVSHALSLPDPRSFGSGNPGATNVLRSGRKAAAALTLLGDGAKGWLAVYLALRLASHNDMPVDATSVMAALAALAVVIGHMYPLFFRFRGGKGVATALGVLLALDWRLALGVVAVWLAMFVLFRISSLAALTAAAAAVPLSGWLGAPHPYFIAVLVIVLLVIARHHSNIRKLLAGTEGRVGSKR